MRSPSRFSISLFLVNNLLFNGQLSANDQGKILFFQTASICAVTLPQAPLDDYLPLRPEIRVGSNLWVFEDSLVDAVYYLAKLRFQLGPERAVKPLFNTLAAELASIVRGNSYLKSVWNHQESKLGQSAPPADQPRLRLIGTDGNPLLERELVMSTVSLRERIRNALNVYINAEFHPEPLPPITGFAEVELLEPLNQIQKRLISAFDLLLANDFYHEGELDLYRLLNDRFKREKWQYDRVAKTLGELFIDFQYRRPQDMSVGLPDWGDLNRLLETITGSYPKIKVVRARR